MVRGERRSSHGTAHQQSAHTTTNNAAATTSTRLSVRVSMEDYYERRRSGSFEIDQPPSYDAFLLPSTVINNRKYNIQPREDEGREVLPAYSSAISLEAVFLRKAELEGAVHRAQDRNWIKVFATLQGTALSFHKCKGGGPFTLPHGSSPDMPSGAKRGLLVKSYNLQHADVGIAADYFKKRYVIRVRAEADQFLLSCQKIETFVLWLQSLFAAIDLAPPLDDRQIPRDLSIPRPRRRRAARTTQTNMERNSALVREQEEIMRTQFPQLVSDDREDDNTIPEDEGPSDLDADPDYLDHDSSEDTEMPPAPPTRSNSSLSSLSTPSPTPSPAAGSGSMTRALAARSLSSTNAPHPSIVPETGKWQPRHHWGPLYDMQYAKRCMAILTERSPRKTNFLIMKGKQWIVDWATGALTRWEPPDYGEVALEGERPSSKRLRINQHGELIAV